MILIRSLCVMLGLVAAVATHGQTPTPAPDMQAYAEAVPGTTVAIDLVPIPVGQPGYPTTFAMGSPPTEEGRGDDEGPVTEVTVAPFWMSRCEITWDVYDRFRREYAVNLDARVDQKSAAPATWSDAVSIPTPLWQQDSAPILQGLGTEGGYPCADISQFAAKQFTKWLSKRTGHYYRLPTEAEWEYAARAGTTTAWSFGDDPEALGDYAWTFDNTAYDDPEKGYPGAGAGYRKVGLKKPNPWGLHDLYGNVSEWVLDAHTPDGYARFGGKPVAWQDAVAWPKAIFPCVARGGNWESDPVACRSASRLASERKWQYRDPQIPKSIWWFTDAFHVGFRIVRPLEVPSAADQLRCWESEAEDIREVIGEGGKQMRVPIEKSAK